MVLLLLLLRGRSLPCLSVESRMLVAMGLALVSCWWAGGRMMGLLASVLESPKSVAEHQTFALVLLKGMLAPLELIAGSPLIVRTSAPLKGAPQVV